MHTRVQSTLGHTKIHIVETRRTQNNIANMLWCKNCECICQARGFLGLGPRAVVDVSEVRVLSVCAGMSFVCVCVMW